MTFEKFNLNEKTALITGAAGLLGIEHAAALLESGARVVLTDISESGLMSAYSNLTHYFDPGKITIKVMDVSDPESISKAAKEIWAIGIYINILLNNAAVDPKFESDQSDFTISRLENFSIDIWNHQLAVGLTGAFLCSKIFGAAMAESKKGGVIINIASDLSIFSPDQRLYKKEGLADEVQPVKPITYSVIKSGLIGMTKYLATYWADKNVRCNALSPGGVFNGHEDEFVKRLSLLIPLGRMAEVNEYRSAIQFLCSDASKYMNGQNVVMDGGRSVW